MARIKDYNKVTKPASDAVLIIDSPTAGTKSITPSDLVTAGGGAKQTDLEELNKNMKNIKTYVGEDKKLHFVDSTGADSVLPFSSYNVEILTATYGNTVTFTFPKDSDKVRIITSCDYTYCNYTINGEKPSNYANLGSGAFQYGASYTGEVSVKKGDIISLTSTSKFAYNDKPTTGLFIIY